MRLLLMICSASLLGLLAGPGPAESCSPIIGQSRPLTKAERAHHAESILVGKIVETMQDDRFNYGGGSEAYTAVMKVYCIYKGEVTANMVNITEVGYIPGMCHSTKLEVGSEYVVFVSGQENRIIDVEIENTAEHRYNVSRACGLKLRYPDGISADDLPHECPEPAPETDCVSEYIYEEPTIAVPEAPKDPESHDPHHKGHDHEGHDHEGHDHEGLDHEGHDHEGHDHEGHDHEGHDHEGHDHEGHDHEGHDHEGHDHEGHDHEGHDHEGHDHEGHDHEGHDHEGHDHEGHDHEGHDHEGHDHEGHDHEGHDHDHDDTHIKAEAGAAHSSSQVHQCRTSSAVWGGILVFLVGICLSL